MKQPIRNYTALNPLLKKSHVHTSKPESDNISEGILEYELEKEISFNESLDNIDEHNRT